MGGTVTHRAHDLDHLTDAGWGHFLSQPWDWCDLVGTERGDISLGLAELVMFRGTAPANHAARRLVAHGASTR